MTWRTPPCAARWIAPDLVAEDLTSRRVDPSGEVVDVGPVAHGGHCVARLADGRVVFVRHALPGERVRIAITGKGKGGRFLRADAVEILDAAPGRRTPACPYSGPGRCGGCDWQHAEISTQRHLKREVIIEALTRFGGMSALEVDAFDLLPREVPGADDDDSGNGWRTRVRYAVGAGGHIGMRRHRSHEVIEVDACPLGVPSIRDSGVGDREWKRAEEVEVIDDGRGSVTTLTHGRNGETRSHGRTRLHRDAGGRPWVISGSGFWQVHPGAADALVDEVRRVLRPTTGEHLIDLYAGVGLFAGSVIGDLGPDSPVDAVEADARACADARRNLHEHRGVRIHQADVESWWRSAQAPQRADLVVLDPPRSGAGAQVMSAILERSPRAVAYVACDPVALARDLAVARSQGWGVDSVVAFDLFPNTQHVETVAGLSRH
jgi:tRNA/tmRNA/rRNA uracil-C5-methylase (TrmA/RlmC/RlmD family)